MPAKREDIGLRINVRTSQGHFLGGTVDIRLEHTRLKSALRELRDVDASHEIAIGGLKRTPDGSYRVFVTRSDPFAQQAKLVNIPASGSATLEFIFRGEDESDVEGEGESDRSPWLVTGVVSREDGLPLPGARVRAVHRSAGGPIPLGDGATDAEGRCAIRYDALPGEEAISLRVSVIAEDGKMFASSEGIAKAKPLETIDLTVPVVAAAGGQQTIEGTIVLDHGLPAGDLKLRLYRRDFGGKATLLDETTTVAEGRYAFSYDAGSPAASLEVRAVGPRGKEVALSRPLNDLTAEARARLNLLAPGSLQPLAAEYRRLSADLTPHVGKMTELAGAKEDDEQQDLVVLNRATGWDARLIALASVTERLAADQDVKQAGLSSEALYGLLRAGLPCHNQALALKLRRAAQDPAVQQAVTERARARQTKADHLAATALTDTQLNLPVLSPELPLEEVLEYRQKYDAALRQAREKMGWMARRIEAEPWSGEFAKEVEHKTIPDIANKLDEARKARNACLRSKRPAGAERGRYCSGRVRRRAVRIRGTADSCCARHRRLGPGLGQRHSRSGRAARLARREEECSGKRTALPLEVVSTRSGGG